MKYTPAKETRDRCDNCGRRRAQHMSNGHCDVSRRGMYGADNPMVKWAEEHAPKEAAAPADTVVRDEA